MGLLQGGVERLRLSTTEVAPEPLLMNKSTPAGTGDRWRSPSSSTDHKAAWGRGYATEGSRALIRKGFADLGVERVTANTMAVNAGSRRVMEKAGLSFLRSFTGDWPDAIPGSEHGEVEYELTRAACERFRQEPACALRPDAPSTCSSRTMHASAAAGSAVSSTVFRRPHGCAITTKP